MKAPRDLVEDINTLADEYYKLSDELGQIAERSGTAWLELRKTCKTNAEADQLWNTTPDGRREAYLKFYLKGLEKLMQARRLAYQLLEGESRNQY